MSMQSQKLPTIIILSLSICLLGLLPQRLSAVSPAKLAGIFNIPLLRLEVVDTLSHSTTAFTQALVLAPDGWLYESTGIKGSSSLRRIDPTTGKILVLRNLSDEYFGEGLAWLNGILYQLTWQAGVVLCWDGNLEPQADLRSDAAGWGLTSFDGFLVQSDGTHMLVFRDANSFNRLHQLEVRLGNSPVQGLNELEFVQEHILANVYGEDFILRISPEDGAVTGIIDASPLRELIPPQPPEHILNGIAWDKERQLLYLTGKNWPVLFITRLVTG